MSSFGSAWISFRFSSFAFFIVPKFLDSMMLLLLRVLGSAAKMLLFAVPPMLAKDGGALRRFKRAAASCCRSAVAVAMASEVRIRLSEDSK